MKKIIKFISSALAACVTLLPFSSCKDEGGVQTIKINEVTHSIFYAPLYVAMELGYFEEDIAQEFGYFEDDIEEDEEIKIPDGYYDLVDYRMDYLTKHNQMKLFQKPIEIETKREAITLFGDFLENDRCNKIIFALSILIPDLKTKFCIDIVIDKLYTYGRTFVTFILVRPDMCDMDFKDPSDTLLEYDDRYIYSKNELITHFSKVISSCFSRCSKVSKENIKIEVYSNTRIQ